MLTIISWLWSFFFSKHRPPRHDRLEDQDTTTSSGFSDDSDLEENIDIEKGKRDTLWRIACTQEFLWKINSIQQQLELLEASTGLQVAPPIQLALSFTTTTAPRRPAKHIILKHSTTRAIGKSNIKVRQIGTQGRNQISRIFTLCNVSCDKRIPPPETAIPQDPLHPWHIPPIPPPVEAYFKVFGGRLLRHWTKAVTHFCPDLADKVEVTVLINHAQTHRHTNMFPPDLFLAMPNPLPIMRSYLLPTENTDDDVRPPTPPRSWRTSTPVSSSKQPKVLFQGTLSGHRDTQSPENPSRPKNAPEPRPQARKRSRTPDAELDLIPGCKSGYGM